MSNTILSELEEINIHEIIKQTETKEIILVGAGALGKTACYLLKNYNIKVKKFFDNKAVGEILGITIQKPQNLLGNILYVLTTDQKFHEALYKQLTAIDINKNDIFVYNPLDEKFLETLNESEYKIYISALFYNAHGYEMNWENPKTYSEKINWEKIYDHSPLKTKLADKFLARDYIKNELGEKYLTKLYGVWDNAKDISFNELPEKFVLKVNNGCERNIIVKDKSKINRKEIISQLNDWIKRNFFFRTFEWQYKNIDPKIICEEYLEGVAENVYEPQFFCFHGEPKYVRYIRGAHTANGKAGFYSPNWEKLHLGYAYPIDKDIAVKPRHINEMIAISRKLSKPFNHVRIDFYDLPDGRLLVGEITFSSTSGAVKFEPEKYDLIWGNLI